jgi:cell division protein FtsI (penicillin-binding protein 3)
MSVKKDIVWRIALVYIAMLLIGIAIVIRIVYLQFIEVGSLTKKAQKLSVRDLEIIPDRGNILAYDGRLLATSVPYYEIRADISRETVPSELFKEKIDSLATRLAQIFKDKPRGMYKRELIHARNENNRYYLLRRKADYEQLHQLRDCPIFRLGKNKGGLIVLPNGVRFMPHGDLAARTIGYISKSEEGTVVGIEGSYDEELRGIKGIKLMQRVPGGIWMPINSENEVEPKNGIDVVTTIDLNIQDVAQEALRTQLQKHNAHHGTAVLMEVKTGEVKAIANLERTENGEYRELFNYAIAESTEPGSTFKLATIMAALEDGYITPEDTIDTKKGVWKLYDKEIKDSHEGGYGKISINQVFELSSNVGVARIVNDNYKGREEQFIKRIYSFGLNDKLGLQIKGEGSPMIKYPHTQGWSGISMAMISHGYELRLTPLQVLAFYNAVANNGRLVRPQFVKELRMNGRVIKSFENHTIKSSICSMSTIRKVRKMMEGVVLKGTATNLKDSSLHIAGKTGTAQIARKNQGYRQNAQIAYQASFVGYFPAEAPKYSCIVVVNAPSNSVYYGNLVAGPVFKEIAQKVYATSFELHEEIIKGRSNLKTELPYAYDGNKEQIEEVFDELGVDYNENDESPWVTLYKEEDEFNLKKRTVIPNLVPNVTGMSAKDAVYLVEKAGLHPIVKGYGKVFSQSIGPGSKASSGSSVILQLR